MFWYYIEYVSLVNSKTKTEWVKDAVYDICPCHNNKSSFNILLDWLPQAEVREWINIPTLMVLVEWRDLLMW